MRSFDKESLESPDTSSTLYIVFLSNIVFLGDIGVLAEKITLRVLNNYSAAFNIQSNQACFDNKCNNTHIFISRNYSSLETI